MQGREECRQQPHAATTRQMQRQCRHEGHEQHAKNGRRIAETPFAPTGQAPPAGNRVIVERWLDVAGGPTRQVGQSALCDHGGHPFVVPETLTVQQQEMQCKGQTCGSNQEKSVDRRFPIDRHLRRFLAQINGLG